MAGWRDSTSQRAQQDLDALVDACLSTAVQLLNRHREFYPFAAVIDNDGKTELVTPALNDEHPVSAAVRVQAIADITGRRESIRAAAIVTDTVVDSSRSAIEVELEHGEGRAIRVTLPYTFNSTNSFEAGQVSASQGTPRIWSS